MKTILFYALVALVCLQPVAAQSQLTDQPIGTSPGTETRRVNVCFDAASEIGGTQGFPRTGAK